MGVLLSLGVALAATVASFWWRSTYRVSTAVEEGKAKGPSISERRPERRV